MAQNKKFKSGEIQYSPIWSTKLMPSLRRGHANLLCYVPNYVYMQSMGININSKKKFHPSRYENQQEYYNIIHKEKVLKLQEIADEIKKDQNKLTKMYISKNNFNKLGWIRYNLDDDYYEGY